ncbi:MAG: hypothetical protein H8E85_07400, partial [Candidatus Marinimicrobia bacterium]|nr:hypothetical protein [Candidatus Neomarinimicrobiota bacterium]
MLGKNTAISGIITILFITIGFSEVSLEIKNVNLTAGTLDIYMTNTAGCSYCTDATYQQKSQCELYGSVNNNGVVDATWMFDTTINSDACVEINGNYFNGEIGGFQFELLGITITDATAPPGLTASTSATTVLGFSLTGDTIPAGSNVLLTQVTFTDFNDSDICFGEDTGSAGNTAISDASGGYLGAEWG